MYFLSPFRSFLLFLLLFVLSIDDCDCVTLSVIPIGCSPYDKGEIIHPICSDPAENDAILVSITIEIILQSRFIEYFSNCGQLKTSDYKFKKKSLDNNMSSFFSYYSSFYFI